MFANGNRFNVISIMMNDLMSGIVILMQEMAGLICIPQTSIQT